jgi:hypothetical protein
MVETSVQQSRQCRKCGADVRQGSLFCYYCGSELAERRPAEASPVPSTNGDGKKRPGAEPLELRSAASIKRSRPAGKRRQVEVVWEAAADGPSPLIIIATAVIVLLTAIIVFLAFYL